jgi:hypothetical protein
MAWCSVKAQEQLYLNLSKYQGEEQFLDPFSRETCTQVAKAFFRIQGNLQRSSPSL